METYKKIALSNVLLRIPLLFLIPISFLHDAILRYIPNSYQIVNGDFLFFSPPLYISFMAFFDIFFSGFILELFWKLIPFAFFIGTLFLLPKVFSLLEVNNREKIIIASLLLFSGLSLLLGQAVMSDMIVLFLALLLFITLEKSKQIGKKECAIIIFLSTLLLYTKESSYFILAGFFLYSLFKDFKREDKIKIFVCIFIAFVLFSPWFIKNKIYSPREIMGVTGETYVSKAINNLINIDILKTSKEFYFWFWMIQIFENVKFQGIFSSMAAIYTWGFFISSLVVSLTIVFGIFKFGPKYKRYLWLILPVFLFEFVWGVTMNLPSDLGRRTFSMHIFLYFFAAKFIESLKKDKIKKLFYVFIIIVILFSIVTSYAIAIHVSSREKEVDDILKVLNKGDKVEIADLYFLRIYEYRFNTRLYRENVIYAGEKIVGEEDLVYETASFQLFLKNETYYVYRKTESIS